MGLANLLLANSTTTPKAVTPEVLAFCEKVVPGQEPKFVPVSPCEGCVPNNCFINVEKVIAANGGEVRYGWIIWENKVFWDAEFHGCWVPPDGWLGGTITLLDVTPKPDGESQILFLPDPKSKWDGQRPVFNVSDPRFDLQSVRDMLRASREKYDLIMKHWVGPGIKVPVPPDELREAEAKVARCWIEIGKDLAAGRHERKSPRERAEERKRQRRKKR